MTFILLFSPSTTPLENAFLALNQFKISSRWFRIVLATVFKGSIFERITRVHHRSRNFPAHVGEMYSQKPWKSTLRRYALTLLRLYLSRSFSFTSCFSVRFSFLFSRHHREFLRMSSCIIRLKTATIPFLNCHHSGSKLPPYRWKAATF